MDRDTRTLNVLLIIAILAGIGYCLYHLSSASSDPRENQLLSALLTILSLIGSWVASRYYSETSYNKNLRLFALKAAEKVTTLSSELDRLTTALQEDLKSADYDTPNEEILAKNYTIENAIYAIRTLKSINDGSLSDWRGIIGAEIDAKREDQEEKEQRLQEMIEMFASVSAETMKKSPAESKPGDSDKLRSDLNALNENLQMLAAQVSGLPLRHAIRPKNKREIVIRDCPICQSHLTYKQRNKPKSIKPLTCKTCESKLYSVNIDGDYSVRERLLLQEVFQCPKCGVECKVGLDPVPGATQQLNCEHCESPLRVSRRSDSVRVTVVGAPSAVLVEPIAEEFIQRVRTEMGPQPWPQGKSREVANALDVSSQMVQSAVHELVRRGIFMLQQNGKLYTQIPTQTGRAPNQA